MKKNIIIGTAGHIDHGKTELIKALTGKDTDRLQEEKERGISIELGFSHLETAETREKELQLGIVDVPGHQKFVNKMLSAAAGIDLALIVVAADEGVMPQTREHLSILDLVGVKKAIIVITKIDLVKKEWLDLIEEDIKEQFADSFAKNSEIVKVSSISKEGIKVLKNIIVSTAFQIEKNTENKISYFPIDRVFTLKGQGTVVTGTLFKGELNQDQEVMLYPSGKKMKIKSLESHQKQERKVSSGSRVGINISGLDKNEISKGDVIAEEDSLIKSEFFEAKLKIIRDLNFKIKNGDRIHFHTAASEVTGTIYIYGEKEAFPGEEVFVKFKLDKEVTLFFKQKYIIRRFSPLDTIGGGSILELDPPPRRKINQDKIVERLKFINQADLLDTVDFFIKNSKNQPVNTNFLKKKSALKKEKILEIINILNEKNKIIILQEDKSFLHHKQYKKLKVQVLDILVKFHKNNRLKSGIKKEELRSRLNIELKKKELNNLLKVLLNQKIIKEEVNRIAERDFEIKLNLQEIEKKELVLKKLKHNIFSPPLRKDLILEEQVPEYLLNYLEKESLLIRLSEEMYFDNQVFGELKILLKKYFNNNKTLDLAKFRDLIKSSRKYAIPLLEKADQLQITERKGDLRYPGKNLDR